MNIIWWQKLHNMFIGFQVLLWIQEQKGNEEYKQVKVNSKRIDRKMHHCYQTVMDYTIPKGVTTIENDCLSSFSSLANVQILKKHWKLIKTAFVERL